MEAIQQWLDRMDVGQEVLGSEAIELLIDELIIPSRMNEDSGEIYLDCFGKMGSDCDRKRDFHFLITTTNLTAGRLVVLGTDLEDHRITLTEGLLASSAFPGVFRPRQSWDLVPGTQSEDQYIDGGVMDNLPVKDVLDKLLKLSDDDSQTGLPQIEKRPDKGPHLVLAGSLEVSRSTRFPGMSTNDSRKESKSPVPKSSGAKSPGAKIYWPELMAQTKELRYNIKLDTYSRISQHIQNLHADLVSNNIHCNNEPLNVRILAIKPEWLCSTFAFHPMLGFSKETQAESIAHGCAATLLGFGSERQHAAAWEIDSQVLPKWSNFDDALRESKNSYLDYWNGKCWLQEKRKCPFSKDELSKYRDSKEPKKSDEFTPNANTVKWLTKIHKYCCQAQTHCPH